MSGVEVVDPQNLHELQTWRVPNFSSFENHGKGADVARTPGGYRILLTLQTQPNALPITTGLPE